MVIFIKSRGKLFENWFKSSVPEGILYERFKDGTSSWNMSDANVRFQAQNVCDCFLFDGSILLYLELKSHKGKSLPLNCIRENQQKELPKRQMHENVLSGLLVEFSDLERVFYLNIDDFIKFKETSDRKSIPLEYFIDYGIEVSVRKLRTSCRYDVTKMYDDIVNREF